MVEKIIDEKNIFFITSNEKYSRYVRFLNSGYSNHITRDKSLFQRLDDSVISMIQ